MDPNHETARSMLAVAQPVDTGVRQTGYQAPAAAQVTEPRVPPVTLGGSEPAPIGTAGRGE
jgi:hypothetical protein